MHEVQTAERVKALFSPFFENGFSFEYFHQKGGDSSCVYVCRFKRGKDYFDLRETSGKYELHFVVYAKGEFRFPSLENTHKKEFRAFRRRHFFKRATPDEHRALYAAILCGELQRARAEKKDFFGIENL